MSDKKNNNNNNNSSNVIEFPVDKIKSKKHRVLMKIRQQKIIFSTSLASVLLIMAMANSSLFNNSDGRDIASSESYREQLMDQKNLISMLRGKQRGIASIGTKTPSAEDRLRFEELDGRYSLRFDKQNKVKEIEFSESNKGFSTPKFINNYESLLNEYKNILAVNFSNVELLNLEKTSSGELIQKIQLSSELSKVGEVDIKMDKYGRLLNLKVMKVVEQPRLKTKENSKKSPGESVPTGL